MDIKDLLKDDNVIGLYIYGSVLYETDDENSDIDYVVIQNNYSPIKDDNFKVYTLKTYKEALSIGDISALEVMYSSPRYVLKKKFELVSPKLDIDKCRENGSSKSNHSWHKGKQLLRYEPNKRNEAIKSYYHSIRILDYFCQIASYGKIIDYSSVNWVFIELKTLSDKYTDNEELINAIESKFKIEYNTLKSAFKTHYPIKKNTTLKNKIKEVLKNHNITNAILLNDLHELIKK